LGGKINNYLDDYIYDPYNKMFKPMEWRIINFIFELCQGFLERGVVALG